MRNEEAVNYTDPKIRSKTFIDSRGNLFIAPEKGEEFEAFKSTLRNQNNSGRIEGIYNGLQNQEIIRLNIEKLGGFESTIDSIFMY